MVCRVSVSQTEVQFAAVTDARHQLLLLALGLVTLVGEDLGLLPSLAVVLDVLRHGVVRDAVPGHRDGLAAQRTHWHLGMRKDRLVHYLCDIVDLFVCYLNVFLVQARTVVFVVLKVVFAKYQGTGVTFHWKKV